MPRFRKGEFEEVAGDRELDRKMTTKDGNVNGYDSVPRPIMVSPGYATRPRGFALRWLCAGRRHHHSTRWRPISAASDTLNASMSSTYLTSLAPWLPYRVLMRLISAAAFLAIMSQSHCAFANLLVAEFRRTE